MFTFCSNLPEEIFGFAAPGKIHTFIVDEMTRIDFRKQILTKRSASLCSNNFIQII